MKENYARKIKYLDDLNIEVTFQDGKIVAYDLRKAFSVYPPLEELDNNRELFAKGRLLSGYGIIWNDKLDLSENIIYEDGVVIGFEEPLINDKIGFLIQKARLDKGMSQSQLAKLSNVDQGDISRLEEGQGNPTLAKIEKVIKALNINFDIKIK